MKVEESESQDAIDAIVDHRRITENGVYPFTCFLTIRIRRTSAADLS